jgi:hypothetical protein
MELRRILLKRVLVLALTLVISLLEASVFLRVTNYLSCVNFVLSFSFWCNDIIVRSMTITLDSLLC